MGDQNRNTFKYRIRRSGQNVCDPSRIRHLEDLSGNKTRASVGRVDDSFLASVEDIEKYRQTLRK